VTARQHFTECLPYVFHVYSWDKKFGCWRVRVFYAGRQVRSRLLLHANHLYQCMALRVSGCMSTTYHRVPTMSTALCVSDTAAMLPD
jgi:hypothetical protein